MKKFRIYIKIIGLLLISIHISSCDKGFTELNTNKVDPTTLNPELIMNHAIINAPMNNRVGPLGYNAALVQQIVSPFGTSLVGGNYNQLYLPGTQLMWNNYYPNVLQDLFIVLHETEKNDKLKNLRNVARIWKALIYQYLTDNYGEVPYFEAGQAIYGGTLTPKYDTQQAIYTDLLKELDEASSALSNSSILSTNDIMYGGDVNKWKRMGYSLMLRVAMRLTKVDPALARTYVTKAITGGVMQSNGDNTILRHNSTYQNPMGQVLNGTEKANFYLTKPFVDFLKTTNDPRLQSFAIRYVDARNGTQQTASRLTSDPSKQIGMPMGHDDVSITKTYSTFGVVSLWDFSLTNIKTITSVTAPTFFLTYAQTQLLLAEAAFRGWISGDASTLYKNGIKAHMEQLASYGTAAEISNANITSYIQANPLTVGSELRDINSQYWVASFLDYPEVWANFRRSGYPALAPNPYPGSEVPGGFIHRLVYPESEDVVNKGNKDAAVSRQGPDDIATRVWWDKK